MRMASSPIGCRCRGVWGIEDPFVGELGNVIVFLAFVGELGKVMVLLDLVGEIEGKVIVRFAVGVFIGEMGKGIAKSRIARLEGDLEGEVGEEGGSG